jgi:hypothetical protein
MTIIKRAVGYSPTLKISVGANTWTFSTDFCHFTVEDTDLYTIMKCGSFVLLSKGELAALQRTPEKIASIVRTGPPIRCTDCGARSSSVSQQTA